MGLVKGFTDIIAPQNLATNGQFRINQRTLFNSDAAPCLAGDYVSDSWKVDAVTVDYVTAYNPPYSSGGGGYIRFQGYGRKGQYIKIRNRDAQLLAGDIHGSQVPITCSITTKCGPGKVPYKVFNYPRYSTVISTLRSANDSGENIIKPNGYARQVTNVFQTNPVTTLGGYIELNLLADGEFDIYISHYVELIGAYIHPPSYIGVNYADDLLRCKRYYQTGSFAMRALGASDGVNYRLVMSNQFPVEMAGTPTMTITASEVQEEGSATNVAANYEVSIGPQSPRGFYVAARKLVGGDKPSMFQGSWNATV
jgi:hypothetical protein